MSQGRHGNGGQVDEVSCPVLGDGPARPRATDTGSVAILRGTAGEEVDGPQPSSQVEEATTAVLEQTPGVDRVSQAAGSQRNGGPQATIDPPCHVGERCGVLDPTEADRREHAHALVEQVAVGLGSCRSALQEAPCASEPMGRDLGPALRGGHCPRPPAEMRPMALPSGAGCRHGGLETTLVGGDLRRHRTDVGPMPVGIGVGQRDVDALDERTREVAAPHDQMGRGASDVEDHVRRQRHRRAMGCDQLLALQHAAQVAEVQAQVAPARQHPDVVFPCHRRVGQQWERVLGQAPGSLQLSGRTDRDVADGEGHEPQVRRCAGTDSPREARGLGHVATAQGDHGGERAGVIAVRVTVTGEAAVAGRGQRRERRRPVAPSEERALGQAESPLQPLLRGCPRNARHPGEPPFGLDGVAADQGRAREQQDRPAVIGSALQDDRCKSLRPLVVPADQQLPARLGDHVDIHDLPGVHLPAGMAHRGVGKVHPAACARPRHDRQQRPCQLRASNRPHPGLHHLAQQRMGQGDQVRGTVPDDDEGPVLDRVSGGGPSHVDQQRERQGRVVREECDSSERCLVERLQLRGQGSAQPIGEGQAFQARARSDPRQLGEQQGVALAQLDRPPHRRGRRPTTSDATDECGCVGRVQRAQHHFAQQVLVTQRPEGWGHPGSGADGEHDDQPLTNRVGHERRRHPIEVLDVVEQQDGPGPGQGTERSADRSERGGRQRGWHFARDEPGEGGKRDRGGRGAGRHADGLRPGLFLQGPQDAGSPHPRCPRQQHPDAGPECAVDVGQHPGPTHERR